MPRALTTDPRRHFMKKAVIDFETRSPVDLRKHGQHIYFAHPKTDAICLSYKFDDGPVNLWRRRDPPPQDLFDALAEGALLEAFNASFEISCWGKLGWPNVPLSQWRCLMARALYGNRPASLEACAALLLPPQFQKDPGGKKLIDLLSIPRKDGTFCEDPKLLQEMYDYCINDSIAEYELGKVLPELPEREQLHWRQDRIRNARGCPIDLKLCKSAMTLTEEIGRKANEELQKLTNNKIMTTGQRSLLLEFVNNLGVNIPNMQAETITEILQTPGMDPTARRVLQLRQLGAPAAVKKFATALQQTSADGRARNQIRIFGASQTGRDSAHGIQLQNLFRATTDEGMLQAITLCDLDLLFAMVENPMDELQKACRGMVCAPPRKIFVDSDLSAVEARIVQWLARCRKGLRLYAEFDAGRGLEPYCVVGGKMFGVDPATLTKGSFERGVGKATELGLGFGCGPAKFQGVAKKLGGVDLDTALCEKTVKGWRKDHPEVVRFWHELGRAFDLAVAGKTTRVGYVEFANDNGSVTIKLPSGRRLFYHEPKQAKNGKISYVLPGGIRIWSWITLLSENVTQATARDFIKEIELRLEAEGFCPVLPVHDQLLCEVDEATAKQSAARVHELMKVLPPWGAGCPIQAETKLAKRLTK